MRYKVPENDEKVNMQELPRISNKPVRVDSVRGEAYYKRSSCDPKHPDASYSIPDTQNPGGKIDIILLAGVFVILASAALFLIS